MKNFRALFLVPLTAAVLAGCAGNGPVVRSGASMTPQKNEPRTERTASTAETSARSSKETDVASTAAGGARFPAKRAPSANATPVSNIAQTPRRRSSVIGLYGEGISGGSARHTSEPGRANLAQISFAVEGACFDPTVNAEGSHLAFASTMHRDTADIYIKSITGTTVTQITSDPADDVMPTFHPDGEQIAFASNRAGKWDIYLTSTDGGAPVQITDDADQEIHPTFSPDGSMMAYCKYSSRSGRWEIWVVELDNPGVRTFLEYGMFPKWSPDVASSKLLFQRARQRGSRLHGVWTIDYSNGEARNPTEIVSAANAAVINPAWSPDGSRIVFVSVFDPDTSNDGLPTQSDLWVVDVDGSNRIKLTDGQFANFQPIWAKDSRVYFVSNRSGIDNIWAVSTGRGLNDLPDDMGVAGVDVNRE